jgi:hypothetical protein
MGSSRVSKAPISLETQVERHQFKKKPDSKRIAEEVGLIDKAMCVFGRCSVRISAT